jgi:hypothetical protein
MRNRVDQDRRGADEASPVAETDDSRAILPSGPARETQLSGAPISRMSSFAECVRRTLGERLRPKLRKRMFSVRDRSAD